MNGSKKLASVVTAAMAAGLLVSASAFADSRPRGATERDGYRGDRQESRDRGSRDSQTFRNDRRSISSEGRVTRIDRDRDHRGYRVWLDRGGYSYFVPESRWRSFPLRVGLSVRIGGWLDPLGYVYADEVNSYRGVRGVVERVDYRRGTMLVRDDYSGDFINVVMRGRDRDFEYVRSGDIVELDGDWVRGVFEAYNLSELRDRGGYGRY